MIQEDFSLSIDQANAQIAALGASLDTVFAQASQQLAANLADALTGLSSTVEITPAVAAPDASEVTDSIDSAVAAADTSVTLSADASDVTAEVDQALADADTTVSVTADADTAPAQESLADLSRQARDTGGGLGDLAIQGERFAGIAALAGGSVGGLERALARSTGGVVAGAAAVGGLATLVKELTQEALADVVAQERFDRALGAVAERVESLRDIQGLNLSIDELTLKLGSADEEVRGAVASLALLGQQAGATPNQIARTSEQFVALAARAVALNPSLGSVGDVLDRLPIALSRGGRFAAQYGINLSQAAIANEAMAETGKTNSAQLTIYERAAAGATLATKQLGGTLATDINTGADSAAFGFRKVREEFRRVLEELGKPLLGPTLELIQEAEPDLEQLAGTLGHLAVEAVPVATSLLHGVAPAVQGTATAVQGLLTVVQPALALIDAIPAPVFAAAGAFFFAEKAVGALANQIAARGALNLAGLVAGAAIPIGIATAAVVGITSAISENNRAKAEAKQRSDAYADAIRADTDAIAQNNAATATNLQHQAEADLKQSGILDNLVKSGVSEREWTEALKGNVPALQAVIDKMNEHGELSPKVARKILELVAAYRQGAITAKDLATFTGDAAGETGAQDQAAAKLAATMADLNAKQAAGTLTLADLTAALGDAGDATVDFEQLWSDSLGKVVTDLQSKVPDLGAAVDAAVSAVQEQDQAGARAAEQAQRNAERITDAQKDLHDKLADIQAQTADDLRGFDESVSGALQSVADSFTTQIPQAAAVFDTFVSDLDRQFEETKRRNDELAAEFRRPLGDDPTIVLPDLTKAFTDEADRIRRFFDEVRGLAARGLDDTVQLLLSKGPEAGAALATAVAGATDEQRAAFEASVEGLGGAGSQAERIVDQLVGGLPAGIAAQTDAATKAFVDHFHIAAPAGLELDQLRAAFVARLDQLQAELEAKARQAADTVTLRNQDLSTSAVDEAKKHLTLDDVLRQLDSQVAGLDAFYAEVTRLTNQGLDDAAQVLLEKGPVAGAELAKVLMAGGADAERKFNETADHYNTAVDRANEIIAASTPRLSGETAKVATAISTALQTNLHLDKATADQVAGMIAALEGRKADAAAAAATLGGSTGAALGQATVDEACKKMHESGLDKLFPGICGAPGPVTPPTPSLGSLNPPPSATVQPPPPVQSPPGVSGVGRIFEQPPGTTPPPSSGGGTSGRFPTALVHNDNVYITTPDPQRTADSLTQAASTETYLALAR